jgi:hypothetical protein
MWFFRRFAAISFSIVIFSVTSQALTLDNNNLAALPEINPTWGAIVSCLAAAVLILRHSAKFRK